MANITQSDVKKVLPWLVPDTTSEQDKDKVARATALRERLGGLFADDAWEADPDKLLEQLEDWILSDDGVDEFIAKANGGNEGEFLTWFESEVEKWEAGEKAPQEQDDSAKDPLKPWLDWYKYDPDEQEYYYSEKESGEPWKTEEQWRELYPEAGQEETYGQEETEAGQAEETEAGQAVVPSQEVAVDLGSQDKAREAANRIEDAVVELIAKVSQERPDLAAAIAAADDEDKRDLANLAKTALLGK